MENPFLKLKVVPPKRVLERWYWFGRECLRPNPVDKDARRERWQYMLSAEVAHGYGLADDASYERAFQEKPPQPSGWMYEHVKRSGK